MAKYNHWFISRQKRQLTQILPALVCFNDICEGKVWRGNTELQLQYEDELAKRSITKHGKLRARKTKEGGGGIRTLYTQMKDLGLVFAEDDNRKVHLTLMGEDLVKANVTFVEAIRAQLTRFQYPSATRWSGSGSIEHEFKIHPFVFMFRLLRDKRLEGYITMDEMKLIIIHEAKKDTDKCFESVVNSIIRFRETGKNDNGISDTKKGRYNDIANTFFNYIELTQYVDRGFKRIIVRPGKEEEIDNIINSPHKFIKHPEIQENYQRAYGTGINSTKDLRTFEGDKSLTKKETEEARIKSEYALIRLTMPITGIDEEVVSLISDRTGIDDRTVEAFLTTAFPTGSVDDFFLTYREYAYGGRKFANEFELATVQLFRKIFKMNASHVGPIGNTPDVFVESDEEQYSGIIDNKAYENGYSIIGDHRRRMTNEYIPNVTSYAGAKYPLAFFSYISTDFTKNINDQLKVITDETGIPGSAMPIDIMIDFAQDYSEKGYTHQDIKRIFSVNRRVGLSDI